MEHRNDYYCKIDATLQYLTDFDYQWTNLPTKEIEYNEDRIKEFLAFTGFQPNLQSGKSLDIEGRYCLDAGCGNGRYTFAMLKIGAIAVDSLI